MGDIAGDDHRRASVAAVTVVTSVTSQIGLVDRAGEVRSDMPSSLIVVGLVVAWLVVLVPMIVRRRQEVARTADSALASRVVRSAPDLGEEEEMRAADDSHDDLELGDQHDTLAYEDADESEVDTQEVEQPPAGARPSPQRGFRPGRGGFDPEAAARAAKARYAFRQRVVLAMIAAAVVTGVLSAIAVHSMWWLHGAIDVALVGYLGYLRRQVRIEEEIRQRRFARMSATRRAQAQQRDEEHDSYEYAEYTDEQPAPVAPVVAPPPPRPMHPGAVAVEIDDEDPSFEELDGPGELGYRRAVGE
jgi:hypothetical protein